MGVAAPGWDEAQQSLHEGVSPTVDDMTDPMAALEVLSGSLQPVRAAPPVDLISTAYDSYQRELYSFALRTAHDPDVAADLVQEAFLRLVGELKAGHPPTNDRAWLYRVVSNLAVSRGRHLKVAERLLHVLRRDETVEAPESSYLDPHPLAPGARPGEGPRRLRAAGSGRPSRRRAPSAGSPQSLVPAHRPRVRRRNAGSELRRGGSRQ